MRRAAPSQGGRLPPAPLTRCPFRGHPGQDDSMRVRP
jgi:hypothetical protein